MVWAKELEPTFLFLIWVSLRCFNPFSKCGKFKKWSKDDELRNVIEQGRKQQEKEVTKCMGTRVIAYEKQ